MPDDLPKTAFLRHVDPARNMRRFYNLTVERDLLGCPVLVRHWGRIGKAGKIRLEPHSSTGEAAEALSRVVMRKVRRGYR